tara:strand:- start:964 stop:1263 length:300 start_codon:yes stop_codon:yes gene_type:complete
MAFKMNGWQSHSGSPNKFIGKRFRKIRRAAANAMGGLVGGIFGRKGGGGSGSGFSPGSVSLNAGLLNQQHANTNTFVPPSISNTDIEGVAFGKKKKTKK